MTFRNISKYKVFYVSAFVLFAVMATGFYLMTDTTTVSAQKGDRASRGESSKGKVARPDMLAVALNMRSATDYTVFGQKGIRGDGANSLSGKSGTGADEASLGENGSGLKARSDLTKTFSNINQLPCEDLEGVLNGGTFKPGVYCSPSASLSQPMVLDAGSDPNGIFVFRVEGSMKTTADFQMSLENGTKAGNVFFAVGDTASIADFGTISGSVIARNAVEVGKGATVKGRAMSVNGEVVLGASSNLVLADGVLEICKEAVGGATVYQLLGITGDNVLIRFNSNAPGTLIGLPVPVTGIPVQNFRILSIDRRPATGEIFGWGNDNILYRIDPVTGAATAVGGPGAPNSSNAIGFDFNPLVDRIRLINNNQQNFRINPNDGTFATDTAIAQDASGAAYTNSFTGAASTTLYSISDAMDQLFIQDPPNAGTMTLVGPLGVGVTQINGFDIFGFDNVAFAAMETTTAGPANLYSINLGTGAATNLGVIAGSQRMTGLTILGFQQTGPTGLENRIFQFTVGGQTVQVPVGGCSGPITLPEGPNVIEELLTGTFTNQTGTWNNRFRLVNVTVSGSGNLISSNFPLRTATVNIQPGGISSQTVVTFFNQFAIPAVIEICKYPVAGDPDVTGFFDFTVDALPNQLFPVPVGGCSGAIQVQPVADPGPVPQSSLVRVTEIAEPGFTLESASTFPADRLIQFFTNSGIVNSIGCSTIGEGPTPPGCVANNPGGGYVTARVVEGDTSNQTTINFFNRTNPGVLKICKIAGPGVPVGTRFVFQVVGFGPSNPFPGAILPPVAIVRTVTVVAGPALVVGGAAEQGGFCNFVRDPNGDLTRFIVGLSVIVTETGVLDDVPGIPAGNFGDTNGAGPPDTTPSTEVRVSRIRYNQSAVPSALFNPSPSARLAIYTQRRGTAEIEFVNYVFAPTTLKVCKVAGPGVNIGDPFTFSISIDTAGGLIPGQTNQPIAVPDLVVLAGPAEGTNGLGFCAFAQGPYTATNTNPPVGTFRVGSTVTVTEANAPGTQITAITTPTGPAGALTADIANRRGILLLGFPTPGVNEIVFTNAVGGPIQEGSTLTLSGRVLTPDGGGLRNAQVVLIGHDGVRRTVPTSSMGYYSFEGLSNETYRVSVTSRRYRFTERNVELNSSLADVNFIGID